MLMRSLRSLYVLSIFSLCSLLRFLWMLSTPCYIFLYSLPILSILSALSEIDIETMRERERELEREIER